MIDLVTEQRLDGIFDHHEISLANRMSILTHLRMLSYRDMPTFEHSVRVGWLSAFIAGTANHPHISPKMLLWAGLLHDVGKILVEPAVLTKTNEFSDEDYEAMKPHPLNGYKLLRHIHEYTAHIIVRHHRFGRDPYPADYEMPELPSYMDRDVIQTAARYIALADYYDALTNRKNDKNGNAPLNSQEMREIYIRDNQDQKELVEKLLANGGLHFS